MTGPTRVTPQHDPAFYRAVGDLLDKLRVAVPTRRDVKSQEVFAVYGAALSGLDMSAFPHAADALIRTATYFPKPAEVRDAVLGVMRRYTSEAPAPTATRGWSGRPDEPCTARDPLTGRPCNTRCTFTPVACASPTCRVTGVHVHWWYEAPACDCAWPAGAPRPSGWGRAWEAELAGELNHTRHPTEHAA